MAARSKALTDDAKIGIKRVWEMQGEVGGEKGFWDGCGWSNM